MRNNPNMQDIERLDPEYEGELIARVRAGDSEAFTQLEEQYGPLMRRLAMTYRDRLDEADMWQEMRLALVEAARDHDTERNPTLAGYFPEIARLRLGNAASAQSSAWNIPPTTVKRYLAIRKRADEIGADPRDLLAEFKMSASTYAQIEALMRTESLSAPADDDEAEREITSTLAAVIVTAGEPVDVLDRLERKMLSDRARASLSDDMQKRVITLAYGFEDVEYDGAWIEPTVPDGVLAEVVGASRSRIQRTRTKALNVMREALTGEEN